MSIFFSREFCSKTVSLLLALAFLVESTIAPVLLVLPQRVAAQTAAPCTFGKMYSSQYSDIGSTIERAQDGGYILGGSTNLRDKRASYHDLLVQKLDSTGKIAWQKIIERGYTDYGRMDEIGKGKQDALFRAVPAPDGGYLAATSIANGSNTDVLLAKLSSTGSVQWQKSYGRRDDGTNHQYPLALRKVSGGYIIAGQTWKYNTYVVDTFWSAFVMKVDDQGNVVWQKRLGTQEGATFASIVQASDGGYFVALTSSAVVLDQGWPGSAIVLFKLDAAGNTQWTKTYAAKFIAGDPVLAPAADGGFVAAFGAYDYSPTSPGRPQDIVVFKLSASGSAQWSRQYGTATGSENATAIQQTADGGYVVLGDDRDDALLFALDASGNIKWQKEYSTGQVWSGIGMDLPAGFTVTPDGGYTIVGKTNRFAPFAPTDEDGGQNRQSYDIFAFKTDASGNIAFLPESGWSARTTNFETFASIISLVPPLRGGAGVADSFDLSASSISANVQSVNLSERDIAEQRCEPLISDNKPDLVISVPPSLNSGSLTVGSQLIFKGTVRNQGTAVAGGIFNNRFRVDIGNDGVIDATDPNLEALNSITALAAGASQQVVSPSWTAVAGTHRLYMCADRPPPPPGNVAESDENNNCVWGDVITVQASSANTSSTAPVLDSITPSSVANGATNITYALRGANFRSDSKIVIFHPSGTFAGEISAVTDSLFVVSSKSEIKYGPFSVIASDPGDYDIQVKNPDGQVSSLKRVMVTGALPTTGLPAPTPTTAPMATLTLEREQERVLPNQTVSFSGTLDSSKVAFQQGSSLVMAISDGVAVDRIEIDGGALATSAFSVNGGSIKIPFSSALYNDSHSFRLVLRNTLPVQLDRRVSVWVTVVDAGNTLLLKGRTASTMVAHLPTEAIGKGTSIAIGTGYYDDGSSRTFRYLQSAQDIDVTRGPFFTPTSVPSLPDNIAFTLFPADASMQRIAFSLKQFSDPLAREFITAQYQYLLGRDPSGEEVSRYLPLFTQWRNSLDALMEVYNRRADVREYVRVGEKIIVGVKNGKGIYASNLPNYDKLIEWATTQGWKEEITLQSFKMQTGYDDAWKLFAELQEKWAPLAIGSSTGWSETTTPSSISLERDSFNLIFELCGGTGPYQVGGGPDQPAQYEVGKADFAACWKDPLKRHQLILWAKDIGWAYNKVVQLWSVTGTNSDSSGNVQTGRNIVEINPSGPILASVFGPGKYPEYVAETAMRYPPAQLYYDLVSSSEYASFPEQRFRKNIDSIFRLFYSRPAIESDIAWTKNMFIRGGGDNYDRYDPMWSWINQQWEPNGQLIASNFEYVDPIEFVKNPSYVTDYFYGIRNIPVETDAVSARLLEVMEKQKYQRTELYQGDNFKRIVVGLYRLYLRRNPTDAEIASERASGKDFGDIEFQLNQSAEYGKNSASRDAVRSIYRNYLGRDPSDAEIASGTLKSISSFANSIGTSGEMKVLAQAHSENAYIFPVKRIKIVSCGFFCSIMGRIIGVALSFIPVVGPVLATAYFATGISQGALDSLLGTSFGGVHYGNATNIVTGSISRSFGGAGFNGETFVQYASIARAMAGQAGGVFSMANLLENADPTILEGFRTMARAPQTPQGNAFAQAIQQTYPGLASPLGAIAGLFGAKQEVSIGRIAQIDVSSHYGSGAVAPSKGTSSAKGSTGTAGATAKPQFTKALAQGSRGAEVLKLQKLLGEMDLTFLPEYQTGYYGAKTAAAVKRFQKRNGLEPVGFVGVKTRALLNSAR